MSDRELIVRCDCHSPEHMMVFDVWHWGSYTPQHSELIFSYNIDPTCSVWKRLLFALRYILTGKTTRCWWSDTVISDRDATRIRDFLSEYLANNLNCGEVR